LPISGYNYSALRDRLKKKGVCVSATTITTRAKALDCYIPHRRTVDAYHRISLFRHDIKVPKAPLHEEIELHLLPNTDSQVLDVRIWCKNQMLQSTTLPLERTRVHL
jgi:hypothetical protein